MGIFAGLARSSAISTTPSGSVLPDGSGWVIDPTVQAQRDANAIAIMQSEIDAAPDDPANEYIRKDIANRRRAINADVQPNATPVNVSNPSQSTFSNLDALVSSWSQPSSQPKAPEGKGFLQNMKERIVAGYDNTMNSVEASKFIHGAGSKEDTAKAITAAASATPQPKEQQDYSKKLSEAAQRYDNAEGVGETAIGVADIIGSIIKETVTNPKGAAYTSAEQAANMAPILAGSWAGAKVGAIGGAAVGMPEVGAVGGALAGMFAGEYPTESGSQFSQLVTDRLASEGKQLTEANVTAVLNDGAWVQDAIKKAQVKGATTSAIDAAFAGVGGRIASGAERAAMRQAEREISAINPNPTKELIQKRAQELLTAKPETFAQGTKRLAGATALDVAGGGASEAGGQYAAYGEVNTNDVVQEMAGELAFAAPEVIIAGKGQAAALLGKSQTTANIAEAAGQSNLQQDINTATQRVAAAQQNLTTELNSQLENVPTLDENGNTVIQEAPPTQEAPPSQETPTTAVSDPNQQQTTAVISGENTPANTENVSTPVENVGGQQSPVAKDLEVGATFTYVAPAGHTLIGRVTKQNGSNVDVEWLNEDGTVRSSDGRIGAGDAVTPVQINTQPHGVVDNTHPVVKSPHTASLDDFALHHPEAKSIPDNHPLKLVMDKDWTGLAARTLEDIKTAASIVGAKVTGNKTAVINNIKSRLEAWDQVNSKAHETMNKAQLIDLNKRLGQKTTGSQKDLLYRAGSSADNQQMNLRRGIAERNHEGFIAHAAYNGESISKDNILKYAHTVFTRAPIGSKEYEAAANELVSSGVSARTFPEVEAFIRSVRDNYNFNHRNEQGKRWKQLLGMAEQAYEDRKNNKGVTSRENIIANLTDKDLVNLYEAKVKQVSPNPEAMRVRANTLALYEAEMKKRGIVIPKIDTTESKKDADNTEANKEAVKGDNAPTKARKKQQDKQGQKDAPKPVEAVQPEADANEKPEAKRTKLPKKVETKKAAAPKTDQQLAEDLQTILDDDMKGFTGDENAKAPTVTVAKVPVQARGLSQLIQKLFGKRVVFINFEGTDYTDKEGVESYYDFFGIVTPASNKEVIYVNAKRPDRAFSATIGHELLHLMREDNEGLYRHLADQIEQYVIKNSEHYKDHAEMVRSVDGVEYDYLHEEVVANVFGDIMMDKAFWEALGENDPTMLQQIAKFIKDFIDNIQKKMEAAGAENFGSAKYLSDLDAVRAAVIDTASVYASEKQSEGVSVPSKAKSAVARKKSPLISMVNKDEAKARVQRRINRTAVVGAPKNERIEFKDANGNTFVVGAPTFQDWINRAEAQFPDKKDFKNARQWYRQLHDFLEPHFGEDAPRFALAWLLSQKNESPSGGMRNVLRAENMAQGKKKVKAAGLNETALIQAIKGEDVSVGVGAKLMDFVDSELGLETRTWMDYDPKGRQPAAIDVWAFRDAGYVDDTVKTFLEKKFGKLPEGLKVDTSFGETQYEYGIDYYNDLVNHLNAIKYDGGGWTAREVQAVGWVATQKAMGIKAEFVSDIIDANTRRISIGLGVGKGSPLGDSVLMGAEIPPHVAMAVVEDIAKTAGVRVRRAEIGVGAYLTDVEGSIQVDAFASPESVQDFLDMIGYALQQTEVIATRALKSGKNHAIDVYSDAFKDSETAKSFFNEILAMQAGVEGFAEIKTGDQHGVRFLNFAGKWRKTAVDKIVTAIHNAAENLNIEIGETVDLNVHLESTKNDWTKDTIGQTYLASLRNRGRLQEARWLEHKYSPSRLTIATAPAGAKRAAANKPDPKYLAYAYGETPHDVIKERNNPTPYEPSVDPLTLTQKFKDWWGKSNLNPYLINPDGTARRLYHGTAQNFEEFRAKQAGAIFITQDEKFADNFADISHDWMHRNWGHALPKEKAEALADRLSRIPESKHSAIIEDAIAEYTHPKVMQVYVRAEKTFDFRNEEDANKVHDLAVKLFLESGRDGSRAFERELRYLKSGSWTAIEHDMVQKAIKQLGFDSFLISEAGRINMGVYDPNQLKSATDNNGEFSRATNNIKKAMAPKRTGKRFTIEAETFGERAQRLIQDKYNRINKVITAVKKAGGNVNIKNNAYLAEERFHGIVSYILDKFRDKTLTPLLRDMAHANVSQEDVVEFAYARHALEANAYIATINPSFPDGGSGMSNADANTIISQMRNRPDYAQIVAFADRMNDISKATLKMRLDGGLITQEVYDVLAKRYKHYIPLKGLSTAEGEHEGSGTGRGYDIRGSEMKRRAGRKSLAKDIMENVVKDYEVAVVRSEKNRVGQTMLKFVMDNPDESLWRVNQTVRQPKMVGEKFVYRILKAGSIIGEYSSLADAQNAINDHTVEIIEKVKTGTKHIEYAHVIDKTADNAMTVKVDGKEYTITFTDQLMADQLKNVGSEQIGTILQQWSKVNRFLSAMWTGLNPVFVAINFFRDAQTALVHSYQIGGVKYSANTMRRMVSAMAGIWRAEFGGTTGDWRKWYEDYELHGAKAGFHHIGDTSDIQRQIESEYKKYQKGGIAATRRYVGAILDTIAKVNTGVENAARLAAYRTSVEGGMSREEAANIAKNLTVNFNRKGEYTSTLGSLYLFFNPSVQGTARLAQAVSGNRGVQALLVSGIALAFALAEYNRQWKDDDDEPWWEKDVQGYEKERNLILMNPDGTRIKFPMPYGYSVFATMGYALSDMVHGVGVKKAGWSVVSAALNSFNPIGGSSDSLLQQLSPTVTDPLIQQYTNKNSFGKQMHPEKKGFNGLEKPSSELYYPSTRGTITQEVTTWLNESTGGNAVREGAMSYSPETVNNYLKYYLGGLGTFVTDSANLIAQAANPAEITRWERAPFIKQFYGKPTGAGDSQRFREFSNEALTTLNEVKTFIKAGDQNKAQEIINSKRAVVALGNAVDNYHKALSALHNQELAIIESKTMTAEEIVKAREEINAKRTNLYKDFNKKFLEANGGAND